MDPSPSRLPSRAAASPLPADDRPRDSRLGGSRAPGAFGGGGQGLAQPGLLPPACRCPVQSPWLPGCLLSKGAAILSAICMYFKLTCARQRSRFMNLITFIDFQSVSTGRDVTHRPVRPLAWQRRRPRAAGGLWPRLHSWEGAGLAAKSKGRALFRTICLPFHPPTSPHPPACIQAGVTLQPSDPQMPRPSLPSSKGGGAGSLASQAALKAEVRVWMWAGAAWGSAVCTGVPSL